MPFSVRIPWTFAALAVFVLATHIVRGEGSELLNQKNLEKWEALPQGNLSEMFHFDKAAHTIQIDATGGTKSGEILLGDDEYGDFKVECTVSFNHWDTENKYSGFNLYLRDAAGDRYWVYLRPNPFDMYAVKIQGGQAVDSKYDEGKKLHQTALPNLVENQDYTLTVEMRGGSLAASLDGQEILIFEDPEFDTGSHQRGKIGVGAESSDVTIKSLKVTNLEDVKKLPIQSYQVDPPPPKKKTNDRELIDGGKDQLVWRESRRGGPVVVFDLGCEYNVSGLKLKAHASPRDNISTYRVLGSVDGRKWQDLASRTNASNEAGEQEQVLSASFSGRARYIKVILSFRADHPEIALGEVEIFGSSPEQGGETEGVAQAEKNTERVPPFWKFPQETKTAWYLGNASVAYEISKKNGQVTAAWNVKTQKRVLLSLEGNYYLEDNRSTVIARESADRITSAKFSPQNQVVELTATNADTPKLTIGKRYQIRDNKLFLKTSFLSGEDRVEFITYNVTAKFEKNYRDSGFYMGGGDGGWPLIPAPKIDRPQKVTSFRNTTKGMVLSQPDQTRGPSFAHVRTRLDDTFVWPWFTGAIASYCEKYNILQYTPDGWDMSLGTSKLSDARPTSFEQFVCLFSGDWQTFLTGEYSNLPEVKAAYAEIPPTPGWVKDIKTETRADIERVKHLLETTDEGNIMVLVDVGGSWAVYDGKVHLIYRAEGEERRTGPNSWPITRLGHAVSENGFDISYRNPLPIFDRSPSDPWREYGCEDPRISLIGDTYYIVFTAMSQFGQTGDFLMVSTTKDFETFTEPERLMPEMEQRTSGLLPGKINGEFCLFHRPVPNMWLSYSRDLKMWHGSRCVFSIREGTWYDKKLGIGPAPLETPFGWLLFWHAKNTAHEYHLGIMLLAKDDPSKVLKVQEAPILGCEMEYEKTGFVPNVVYTNGVVEFQGRYFVYYGCCDRCLAVATVDVEQIHRWCRDI